MDVLILLFGGNPMPNFVTAKYLLNEKRKDMEELPVPGKFVFVYSRETERFKNSLTSCLGLKDSACINLGLGECERSFVDVKKSLKKQLIKEQSKGLSSVGSVHLNYTGGTKQMAIAAFQVVSEFCGRNNIKPVFSYLDPKEFKLTTPEKSVYHAAGEDLRDWVVPSIDEVYKLHCLDGRNTKGEINKKYIDWFRNEGILPKICMKEIQNDFSELKKNILEERLKKSRDAKDIERVKKNWRKEIEKWFNEKKNQEEFDYFINNAMKCKIKIDNYYDFYKFVSYEWLEQKIFDVLSDLSDVCGLNEVGWDISKKGKDDFQVDVIAMRGYQPIVFSCTTDNTKPLIKQKAFEVNYRSVQLGGEHAKRVMVCLGDEDVCEGVKKDMSQFDAVKHFEIIGREQVEDDEKLRNAIKSILKD